MTMTQCKKIERAREMVSQINDMIEFAESESEFLIAAKLEDARVLVMSRLVDASQGLT